MGREEDGRKDCANAMSSWNRANCLWKMNSEASQSGFKAGNLIHYYTSAVPASMGVGDEKALSMALPACNTTSDWFAGCIQSICISNLTFSLSNLRLLNCSLHHPGICSTNF